jgi:hypothetical protein
VFVVCVLFDSIEVVHSVELDEFVSYLVGPLISIVKDETKGVLLLYENENENSTSHYIHRMRNVILEILTRLPHNEILINHIVPLYNT